MVEFVISKLCHGREEDITFWIFQVMNQVEITQEIYEIV